MTLGVSTDFYDSLLFKRDQLNPKAGMIWNPIPSTTLRLGAFRTLHRALVSSQTIEPTQVAGFNQFFADAEGVETVRYGFGVDQKASDHLFGGAEYSWRDLKVPVEFTGETTVRRFARTEKFGRSYIYWTPQDSLSMSAEYFFEVFDRSAASSGDEQLLDLRTHRVPLSVRYFSPKGWYANLTRYVRQSEWHLCKSRVPATGR